MTLRTGVLAILLVCLSTPSLRAQAPPKGSGPIDITGPVRVIDGDTIEVFHERRRIGVGLIGVRAPQGNTSCGRQATEFLQTLLENGVRLEEDPNFTFDTRNRRMYRALTLVGRTSVVIALVRSGFAVPDGQGSESTAIAAEATAARQAQRGCAWRPETILNPIR